MDNKLYIIKYVANEFDDLRYSNPYPIYYSLDKQKVRAFFEDIRKKCIESFNDWISKYPEFKNNENYQITENTNDYFEYYMGNWFYIYEYEEQEFDVDLTYKKYD